jgi:AcrR family transcriptional regulator
MIAKKAVPEDKKAIIRDKDAKIEAIMDATQKLISSMGYEKVTIRDIAEKADVSVGLIYKYFPGGKFEILTKGLADKNMDLILNINHVETVNFEDFPGFIREFIEHMQKVIKDNNVMMKALIAASLLGGEIADDIKNMDINDFVRISEFFCRFKGVDTGGREPIKLLLYWGTIVKGTFISCMMYPLPPEDEAAIVDLLVDQSLRIWGYQKP